MAKSSGYIFKTWNLNKKFTNIYAGTAFIIFLKLLMAFDAMTYVSLFFRCAYFSQRSFLFIYAGFVAMAKFLLVGIFLIILYLIIPYVFLKKLFLDATSMSLKLL
jgi:hypothetical protein